MKLSRAGITLLVLITALAAAGCGSTQSATSAVKSTWVGRPADQFFAKFGPPKLDHAIQGGGRVFQWESVAMPSGTSTKITCSANILTDHRGAITEIQLQMDSIGHWNTSRCAEIFSST